MSLYDKIPILIKDLQSNHEKVEEKFKETIHRIVDNSVYGMAVYYKKDLFKNPDLLTRLITGRETICLVCSKTPDKCDLKCYEHIKEWIEQEIKKNDKR